MSRWGIGPIFTVLSIGYALGAFALNRHYHPVFQINVFPSWLLSSLGIILIMIGVPFFIISVITVTRAYNADKLVTNGIFRCCRHPLYASWVVFIVPGTVLIMKSWIKLTIPVFMYLILRLLVKKEEVYLENVFGFEYREYKKKVPCVLPIGKWHRLLLGPFCD
jgi:protein-S-isoprenylcysteine O-methyltransferase Ste14